MENNLKLISAVELIILLNQGYVITTKNLASHFCSVKQDGMEFEIFIKWQDGALPDLAELKKEFDSTTPQLLNDGIVNIGVGYDNDEFIVGGNVIGKLWQWLLSKIEPCLTALSKLQLQYLEATEQIEQLKAENEKLSAEGIKLGYFIFKDACGEQVRKEVYDNYTGFKQVLPIEIDKITEKARQEERARIVDAIMKIPLPAIYLGYRSCVLGAVLLDITCQQCKELQHKECKQTLEDCEEIWIWRRTYSTADHPQLKPPQKCYEEFGQDLDGCSRQENEGCKGCKCLVPADQQGETV